LAAIALLCVLAAALWWKADRMLAKADAAGYARRAAEDHAAQELQREANRGRARQVEQQHATRAEIREEFLVITAREVHHEAASLAACPVPEPVRLRLNAAAECAREDRPAACGAGEPVREP
jgi:hypothetical protein